MISKFDGENVKSKLKFEYLEIGIDVVQVNSLLLVNCNNRHLQMCKQNM